MRNAKTSKRGCAAGPASGALCAALLFAAVLAQGAAAQQLTGFPQAELPRYTIELIVFTYTEGSTGNEIFVPESPPFDEFLADGARHPDAPVPVFSDGGRTDSLGEVGEPGEPAARPIEPAEGPLDEPRRAGESADPSDTADEAAEITGIENNLRDIPLRARIELQLLAPEQYTMDEIFERLVALDAYQPVMRTAWTQTTPARDESPSIRLRALGEPPPGLTGTVTLYQGRFVHLGVDLELDAEGRYAGDGIASESRSATDRAIADSRTADNGYGPAASDSRRPIPVYSDRGYSEMMPGEDGAGFPQPVHYRIDEVRIMRDGDIRYYDHPHFGVIAKLTEVPEEAENPAPPAGD